MSRKNLEMCSYKSVCVSHTDIHVNILEVIPQNIRYCLIGVPPSRGSSNKVISTSTIYNNTGQYISEYRPCVSQIDDLKIKKKKCCHYIGYKIRDNR